jgi:hypothetical protein
MIGAAETHKGFGFGSVPILMGLVGLQLMLLAFFIVLVGMSSFDSTRVDSVLGSIQQQFAALPGAGQGENATSSADALSLEAVRDEVAGVLATRLQLDRIERNGTGAVEIEFAADKLFAEGTAQLLPGIDHMLQRTVAAIDRRPAGFRYELDVLVGRPQGGPADALAVDRAGALVRAFIDFGASPSSMSAGLQPASPGRVRLALRLIEGARPTGLFADLPAAPRADQP